MAFPIGSADHARALALAKEHTRKAGEYSMGALAGTSQGVSYRKAGFDDPSTDAGGTGRRGAFYQDTERASSGKDKDMEEFFENFMERFWSGGMNADLPGSSRGPVDSDSKEVA